MDVKYTSACVPAHGHQRVSACKGTSLIDILTTMAIASLLFGFGIPGFQSYLTNSRLVANINLLSRSLALTRSEAVKRETSVVICKSRDKQHCNQEGSWRQGWIIFEDRIPDRRRDKNEPLIFVKSELPTAIGLDYAAFRSSNFIAFGATGITKTNGTFTLCYNQDAHSARALIMSKTGRIRFSRTRADGRPLRCPGEKRHKNITF